MKNAIRSFLELITEKRLTTVAGAWVFFFLTSVIPIMFLLITAFGVFGVNLSLEIVSRLPEEFRTAGETIVFTAENASKSATILFVFTVIFSSSALINQMSKDGDFIYGAKNKNKRGLLRRLWAIAAMLLTFIVFLVAAFLTAFGGALFSSVNFSGARQTLSTFLFFFLVIVIGYFFIIMLNKFICPVRLKFSQVAIGSLCSLFIIVLGTIAFTLYLRFFNSYNAFYGSLAAIIIFLLWAYILMIGLVFGVIVNCKVYMKNRRVYDPAKNKKISKNLKAVLKNT